MIVCEDHGCLHIRTTFHLGLYNLFVIKFELNYILQAANTRERVVEKFPGCEEPLCCTLHTAAVDMPGYDASLEKKYQIVSASVISTQLLLYSPHWCDNRNQQLASLCLL